MVDLCVCQAEQRGFPHGGDPTSSCSLCCSPVENPVSPFSLPFSPLLMPLQVPAAPRPPHLAGRETRFVSALGVRCRCCSRCPLRCPTSPRGLGSPGAPPGLAGGAAPRWHPRHEGLLPVSCCCDGTRQGFGEELRGDGFARARGRVWRVGTCPGTVTLGQDLEMCPGARTVPDLGSEFGDVQRAVRASSHSTGAGKACGGGLWPVLTLTSRCWGVGGVLWDLQLPTQGGQWGRDKLKVFRMDSRFTPVFLFAGFH